MICPQWATQWAPGIPDLTWKVRIFLVQEVLFAIVEESLLNSGATIKAVFILGMYKSVNEYVAMVTS